LSLEIHLAEAETTYPKTTVTVIPRHRMSNQLKEIA